MSGMTLASTGDDGMVRLWQSDLNGVWHEQAALEFIAEQQYQYQSWQCCNLLVICNLYLLF